jgi:hypothetical protein
VFEGRDEIGSPLQPLDVWPFTSFSSFSRLIPTRYPFRSDLRRGMRKCLLDDPRVVGKKSQNLSRWRACALGEAGRRIAQLAPNLRTGREMEGSGERRGGSQGALAAEKRCRCWREQSDSAPPGTRMVQHSQGAGGPARTPLPSLHSALCCVPLPLAPAPVLRPPAP